MLGYLLSPATVAIAIVTVTVAILSVLVVSTIALLLSAMTVIVCVPSSVPTNGTLIVTRVSCPGCKITGVRITAAIGQLCRHLEYGG